MSVDGADRYLIAAGTEDYPNWGEGATLPSVPQDVEKITEALTALGYQVQLPELGDNPTKSDLEQKVGGWLTDHHRKHTDTAVFYYSGHGDTVESVHYLLTKDSVEGQYAFTAVRSDFFVEALGAQPRVRRLLLILDTCFSGEGAFNAREIANQFSRAQNLTGEYEGVWVVTASRSREEADQGVFAGAVARAVDEVQRDVGVLQRYLGLEAVVEQINKNLAAGGYRQRASWSPATLATGLAPFFPNRDYQPDAPVGVDLETRARLTREITTHWAPKGRGIEVAAVSAGWYFTGRVTALRELVSWISDPGGDSRLRVVTGDPGSGKSALLGRLVLLSLPVTREMASRDAPPDTIPPEGSITVALLARGKTVEGLKAELADQLGIPSGRDPIPAVIGHHPSPLIVIDALDEATNPQLVIDELITPLHKAAGTGVGLRLLVATRRHLLHLLPDGRAEIDLDTPDYLRSEDVTDYVTSVLLAADDPDSPTPYRNHLDLARQVAEVVAAIAGHSFLIAQIAARILTRRKDTLVPEQVRAEWHDWADVGYAFDADLTRYGTDQARVRELLAPLAWAQGNGLPRELWADTATALAGHAYSAADVAWVLTNAGAYIAEALEDDRSVYRLYHQEFTDHLKSAHDAVEANKLITQALLGRVPVDPESKQRSWLAAHPYIRTHLATHAAAGGLLDDLLADPGFLVAAAPERLLPTLRSVTSPDSQLVAAIYMAAAPLLDRRDPSRAAAQLQLAARQQGVEDFADRINLLPARRPWTVSWTSWRPEGRNLIIGHHTNSVCAVAVGQFDGRPIVVSGSGDRTVRVWDLATGQPVGESLEGHTERVSAVAVGQLDGRTIVVSGSDDHTVRVWDLATGQPVGEPLKGHTGWVSAVAVDQLHGHPIVVTGCHGGTVRVWDLVTGQPVGKPLKGHTGWVSAVAVGQLHGRPIVITGSDDRKVRVWDLTEGRILGRPLTGHTDLVNAVAAGQLHGRTIVVSGGDDHTVRVWDFASGQPVGEPLEGHTGSVSAVAAGLLYGRPIVVSGSGDRTVRVWDLVTGQPVGEPLKGHTDWVRAVVVGQFDGRPIVVSGSHDGTVRVWDFSSGQPIGGPLTGHTYGVNAVAVGQLDGRPIVVSGSGDRTVRVWDLAKGQPVGEPLKGHTYGVNAVAVGQLDGRPIVVSGSGDRTVRVWDLAKGQPVGEPLKGHTYGVNAVAVGQLDGRPIVVSGSGDRTVRVWDLAKGQPVGEPLKGHTYGVNAVAVGQLDGRPIAVSGSGDGTVRVWDLAKGQPAGKPLKGHTYGVNAVAVGQLHGRTIVVSGSNDRTVRVWDLDSWKRFGEPLAGHDYRVDAVAVGQLRGRPIAVSGGWDGTVRVWDLARGQPVGEPLKGHTDWVRAVAVGQFDGRPIAVTGSDDHTVRAWDFPSRQPLGQHLEGHTGWVNAVAVGQFDGRPIVVSGSDDRTVRVWDLAKGQPVGGPLAGHTGWVRAVAVGQFDGRPIVVSGGDDRTVRVWDLNGGKPVGEPLIGHTSLVTAVAVGQLRGRPIAVSSSWDGTVRVWDLAKGRLLGEPLIGHIGWVRAVAVGQLHGRPIVASGVDNQVQVWDLAKGRLLGEPLIGHTGWVRTVAVGQLHSRPIVVSGGDDRTVRVWDLVTGQPVGEPLKGHTDWVRAVAVGQFDGRPIAASGSNDETVRVWDLITGALTETINVRAEVACVASGLEGAIIVGTTRGLLALQLEENQKGQPSEPNLPHPAQTQPLTVTSRLRQWWQRLLGNS